MPPHCDSLDGPVVTAARQALDAADVNLVLPFVPEDDEEQVRTMFAAVLPVRALGESAREVADRLFFETVVRLHRAGEGAPFTGLKPAGLDVGPVIALAERAIATGTPEPVTDYLTAALRNQLEHRLDEVNALATSKGQSVAGTRAWVEAMLGFEVYSHRVLEAITAPAHGDATHSSTHSHAGEPVGGTPTR
jgi:hypothetical protein